VSHFLLTGARGMLGRAFRELFARKDHTFVGLDLPELDIADRAQVEAVIDGSFAAVINCAAYTNVDAAEADEAAATRANGEGPGVLAQACAKYGVPLVHFSTDYVFAGNATRPYRVDDELAPLGAYGRSKARGEQAIAAVDGPHLIVRTSWLYAPWANNFVRTMVKMSRERETFNVVNDQRGRPTSAEHLAETTLALLEKKVRGLHHVTDGGECTWFEFANEIVRLAGSRAVVKPCTSAEFVRAAQRPAYSVLDLSVTEATLGRPMPPWQETLASVMARLEA
jgi:dTDP-4-dehydrorhamnose reductase